MAFRTFVFAVIICVVGCKTSKTEADPPAAQEQQPTAPEEVERSEPEPEQVTFVPVTIPGTPHDEEGTSIRLMWAAESGEVTLVTPAGSSGQPSGKARLEHGKEIEFGDTVVVVTRGARLTAASDEVALTDAMGFAPATGVYAETARDETITRSDEVYMLKYAGEGTCYVQVNDNVFLANCPNDEFQPVTTKPEQYAWWVMIGDTGWLRVDERVKVEVQSM